MSATAHLMPGCLGLNRTDLSPLNARQSPEHDESNHHRAHRELLTDRGEQTSQERREKQSDQDHTKNLSRDFHSARPEYERYY